MSETKQTFQNKRDFLESSQTMEIDVFGTDDVRVSTLPALLNASQSFRDGLSISRLGYRYHFPESQRIARDQMITALAFYQSIRDWNSVSEIQSCIAESFVRSGNLEDAAVYANLALDLPTTEDSDSRLRALCVKALILLSQSEFFKVRDLLFPLSSLIERTEDIDLAAFFYFRLGAAEDNLGDIESAIEHYRASCEAFNNADNSFGAAVVNNNLSQIYARKSLFDQAHVCADNAIQLFKKLSDRVRHGFSLDSKAKIHFAEKQYVEALELVNRALELLSGTENKHFLVETYLTKVKVLIEMNRLAAATVVLHEAVEIARNEISEETAEWLVNEYETAVRIKRERNPDFDKSETSESGIRLLLPPEISESSELHGIWMHNDHLAQIGLKKGYLALVIEGPVQTGDLTAVVDKKTDLVSCGYFEREFGVVCLEGCDGTPQIFEEFEVEILGRIVGFGNPAETIGEKIVIRSIPSRSYSDGI